MERKLPPLQTAAAGLLGKVGTLSLRSSKVFSSQMKGVCVAIRQVSPRLDIRKDLSVRMFGYQNRLFRKNMEFLFFREL